jgi:RecB family exonuclease
MAKVSYSQYSMWSSCPQQFKLNYIDKLGESSANIHTIFGSAMHETIQHFLSVMYGVTKKQALELDLEMMLKDKLVEHFTKEKEKLTEGTPCTREELEEFYGDGRQIIQYFKSKLDNLYTKSGFELVAIEMPLNAQIKDGVHFIGFIDIVLKDVSSGEIIIVDLKTSTNGWNKYQKADKIKTSQMLLYKKFYSEKYDIPLEKVKVEYQILKRKLRIILFRHNYKV